MRILFCVIVVLGFIATAAAAQEPRFPAYAGKVVDEARILTEPAARQIARDLSAYERRTGHQIAVATVPSLQGLRIDVFANRLFNSWGLGRKGVDDGVLLLVAPNEREVRIEVGRGLTATLSDATATAIIYRDILPAFREDRLGDGITGGVAGIIAELDAATPPPPPGVEVFGRRFTEDDLRWIVPIAMAVAFVVGVALLRHRQRLQRRAERRQRRLDWKAAAASRAGAGAATAAAAAAALAAGAAMRPDPSGAADLSRDAPTGADAGGGSSGGGGGGGSDGGGGSGSW